MATFEELFNEVILHEGTALTDDPDDRGGLTKFGISKAANPDIDVENLTLEEAKNIYKERYWDKFKIGNMPEKYRRDVFMNVVNSGSAFIEDMQSALGVSVDGVVGSQTLGALKKQKGSDLSSALFDAQVSRYINLAKNDPSQRKYLNGWMNRVIGAKPGEVFSAGKTDLRDLDVDQIKNTVNEVFTERQVMTPDTPEAQPTETYPQIEPTGFLDNLVEIMRQRLSGSQSESQAPLRRDTQDTGRQTDSSEARTEPEQEQPSGSDAIIQSMANAMIRRRTNEAKLERTANEAQLEATAREAEGRAVGSEAIIQRLANSEVIKQRVYDRSNLNADVPVEQTEELAGGRDASKDPVFGLF